MRFNLVDKVEQLDGNRIVAVKFVSLAEEYLADHFPTFPVLPGVLMLESATQSASWLVHHRTDFSHAMAVLREARNVKYGHFVAPGEFLRVQADLLKIGDGTASFKAVGFVGSAQAFQMRLEVAYFNLADRNAELAAVDERLREHNRRRWDILNSQTPELSLPVGGG